MQRVIVSVFVCLLAVPAVARAQRGGWVDVNFGVAASTAEEETFTYTDTIYQETRTFGSGYPKPSTGASFDFGGGFMFTPLLGLGVTFSGQGHKDQAALAITVPHPYFFNRPATAAAPTEDKLTRAEGAMHIQLMVAPVHTDNFRFRVFGGPTYHRLKADMVQDIEYTQLAFSFSTSNVVEIDRYDAVEAEGTGWGYHAGADVSWFFSRVVGIGGLVRFTGGTVTLDPEPMSEIEQDVKVGGIHAGGGLRLRF